MAVDTATTIAALDATKPTGSEPAAELDDNIRQFKGVVKSNLPNIGGTVTASHTELSYVTGVTSAIQTQLDAKAPLASPALTGSPTAPTAAVATSTTQLATTAFVQTAIATVNASTPLTLAIDSSSTVQLVAGQHTICTNPAAVLALLPATVVAGQRTKVTFTNTVYTNVIDPGSNKVYGVSGTRSVNAASASAEFTAVNASIGWVY